MKWLLSNNLLLLLWVSLMASSFVFSADLIPYANPIASTGLRFILASILMLPLIISSNKSANNASSDNESLESKKIFFQYGLISLFLVMFFVGLFEALKTTTALRTSVIYTLVPLISIVLTYFLLKTKTAKIKILGFILGSLGATIVVLAFNKKGTDILKWHSGDVVFLFACMSLSAHVVLVKKWGANISPIQGSFYIMVLGGLMLLPLMLMFGELDDVAWENIKFWEILLYLTVFTTMVTFFLQQRLVQKIGPNQLLAATYLIPILVVLPKGWAAIAHASYSMYGVLIIFLALYLISKERKTIL